MNEDKMELEELIKIYNEFKKHKEIIGSIDTDFFFKFAETVLQALKNSIPKKKIREKLKEVQLPNVIVGGRRNGKTLEYGIKLGRIKAYEELLEDK